MALKLLPECVLFRSKTGKDFNKIHDPYLAPIAKRIWEKEAAGNSGISNEYHSYSKDGKSCGAYNSNCVQIFIEDLKQYVLPQWLDEVVNPRASAFASYFPNKFSIVCEDRFNCLPICEKILDVLKKEFGLPNDYSGASRWYSFVDSRYSSTRGCMEMDLCPQENRFTVSQFMAKYDQYVSQQRFDSGLPISEGTDVEDEKVKKEDPITITVPVMSALSTKKVEMYFTEDKVVELEEVIADLKDAHDTIVNAYNNCIRVSSRINELRIELENAIARDDVSKVKEVLDKIEQSKEYVKNFGANTIDSFVVESEPFDVAKFFG